MKSLVFLMSILAAIPLNDRTFVQKSCQTTCSGKTDNFVQFNSYALMLQGKSQYLSLIPSLFWNFSWLDAMWIRNCWKYPYLDVLQYSMFYDWRRSGYLQARAEWFQNISSSGQNRDIDSWTHEKYWSGSSLSSNRFMLKHIVSLIFSVS